MNKSNGTKFILPGFPYRFDCKDCALRFAKKKGIHGSQVSIILSRELTDRIVNNSILKFS